MLTTLARSSSLLFFSTLLLSTACNDKGSDPTAVWDDERVRNQGTLTVSPSSFQAREGESVTLHADYEGTAQFSPSQVNWTVRPVGAGMVQNGVFTAEVAGPVMIEGRFSSLADTAEATIRPELIDFVPLSPESTTAAAGRVVPDSVSVKVLGRRNAPVPGEVVEFEVVDGEGAVSRYQRVTDANGTARVAWLLGPRPGENGLRAVVEGFELRFRAEGEADRSSARIRNATSTHQDGTVGELLPAPLVVEVVDARGNRLADMPVRWSFANGSGTEDPESETSDASLVVRTDDRGRSAVYWRLGGEAGSQEVEVSLESEATASRAPGGNGNGNGNGGTKFEASAKPGHLASIAVEPTPVSMSVGNTVTLSVTGTDEYGNTVEVTDVNWSSSDASVAPVDGAGTVTGMAEGSASIEAKVGPNRAYAEITVAQPEAAAVTSVVASHEEISFDRFDQTVDADATAFDATGAVVGDAVLEWTSSDPAVATVSADGVVTSVGNGSAEIVVASACCGAADTIVVTVDEPAVVQVTASPPELTISELGAQAQIAVELVDARGSVVSGSVSWMSADPLVASVDGSGLVTAVSNGSTRVVAAADCCDVADTVEVVVHEPVLAYIAADPKSVDLTVGDTTELSAAGFDTAGDTAEVELTWASADQSIAEVDQVGTLIAKGQGIAAIVVAAACCTAADTVLVGVDEEPITPSRVEASWEDIRFRALEETFQLEATAFDEQERTVVDARYTWTSTDPSVASVDSMGLVTARANGIAAIVLASTCCTVSDTVPVTVDQEVSLVVVEPGALTLEVGQERDLEARVEDLNGFAVDVPRSWRSTNPNAATVDDAGHVVAIDEGLADVEIEAEGVIGSSAATVVESPSSAEPVFSDGFEAGTLAHTASGYRWSQSSSGVAIVSSGARNGTYALAITNEGGDPDNDTFQFQEFAFGSELSEVWTEVWVYVPDNYYHRDSPSSDNNKFFQLWADTRSSPDKLSMILEVNQDGGGGSNLRPTRDNNFDLARNFTTSKPNFITDSERGRWNQLQVHVKVGTFDNRDGVIQVWWNGELWVDEHNVDYYKDPSGGLGDANFIANGRFLGWANSGYDEDTTFLFDDFRIFEHDPGW